MHIPVLQKEVLEYLDQKPNENFIDATVGGAGHAEAILEKIKPNGRVLGIEWDSCIFEELKKKNIERLVLINDSYVNLKKIVEKNNFGPVSGILFDLGMSSWHLEESGRGFTFLRDEPLDMRYSLENDLTPLETARPKAFQARKARAWSLTGLTAEKVINQWSEAEIVRILKDYGQERFARRIAKKIIKERPIKTTFQLVELLKKAKIYQPKRTFQALRIAVNGELNNLEKALPQTIEVLERGGRIVVISFHSLEDKIVKNFFKNSKLKILTKKPILPSQEEIKFNPRSRSAKLRAAEKIC